MSFGLDTFITMHNIVNTITILNPFLETNLKQPKQLRLSFEGMRNSEAVLLKVAEFSTQNSINFIKLYSYNNYFIINKSDSYEYLVLFELSDIVEYLNKTITREEIKPSKQRWWSYLPNWVFCLPEFIHIDFVPIFRVLFSSLIQEIDIWDNCSDYELEKLTVWSSKLHITLS